VEERYPVIKPIYKIGCDHRGTVEHVYIEKDSYVYEWEKLFLIKTDDGRLINISIGTSGYITELNVTVGDQVTGNTPLALLQDDFVISGSD
jgi:hypothetical protein